MKRKVYKHSLFPYTNAKLYKIRVEYFNHVRDGQKRALRNMTRSLRKYNPLGMPIIKKKQWQRAWEMQFKSELLKAQLRIISKVLGEDK